MYEVVWQYDETAPFEKVRPEAADEARRLLVEGNESFAQYLDPQRAAGGTVRHVLRVSPLDFGLSLEPGRAPTQEPFAAFLSCADARVPVELIFGQQANDLFVVRVVGNVLGDACLASLGFAVDQLGTIRLVVVMGHTGCGAVTAAVNAYLAPTGYLDVAANFPLHAVVSSLLGPTHAAAVALSAEHGDGVSAMPGYRPALVEVAVILNAAMSAAVLRQTFHSSLDERLQVAYGVYDLHRRTVGLPHLDDPDAEWQTGLYEAPTDKSGIETLSRQIVGSRLIRRLLGQ